jgi:hypothetical protein
VGNLRLTIEGREYDVEILDEPGTCVQLTAIGSLATYEVAALRRYNPREATHEGLVCDCPDFGHRHAGTGSEGCKHIRAAVAARLVEPRSDAEPDDEIPTAADRLAGQHDR